MARQGRRGTRAPSGPGSPLGRGAPSQTAGPRPARPPRGPFARPPPPGPGSHPFPACCPAARGRPSAVAPERARGKAAQRATAARRPLGLFKNRLVGLSARPREGASGPVTSLVARSAGGAGLRTRRTGPAGLGYRVRTGGATRVGLGKLRRPG